MIEDYKTWVKNRKNAAIARWCRIQNKMRAFEKSPKANWDEYVVLAKEAERCVRIVKSKYTGRKLTKQGPARPNISKAIDRRMQIAAACNCAGECVGNIASRLNINLATAYRDVADMTRAGQLKHEKRGRVDFYVSQQG